MRLFGWDTWRGSFRGSSSEEQQDSTTLDASQDTQQQEAVRMDQLTPERKEVFSQVSQNSYGTELGEEFTYW